MAELQLTLFLQISHLNSEMVRERFPGMAEICSKFGLDLTQDKIPVRPGAHYMIGGVQVDEHARTSVPRLFAAGEVTSSGLHGANRLASNSLLEGLVYGARAGEVASEEIITNGYEQEHNNFHVPMLANRRQDKSAESQSVSESLDLGDIRNSLRALMWRHVGVERSGSRLACILACDSSETGFLDGMLPTFLEPKEPCSFGAP